MSAVRRGMAVAILPVALMLGVAFAAGTDDAASRARKELADLEALRAQPALSGSKLDGGLPPPINAASHAIDEARKALSRAAELRGLGDVTRAEMAEDAALEWALAARELVRAIDLERKADEQGAAAASASGKAARARTLLEEAIARRAKLQADVDALDVELAARALDAGPADGGAPTKGAKPKPKKGAQP